MEFGYNSIKVTFIFERSLTWKKVKAKVKYITKEYEKGITYSKEVMKKYEGINIHRNSELKKWSIVITPEL